MDIQPVSLAIHGVVGGLCILAGIALGWTLRGSTPVAEPPAVASSAGPTPSAPDGPRTPTTPVGTDDDTCQRELAFLQGAYDSLVTDAYGSPSPFPDDLPDAFRPEAFHQAVHEVVSQCPELGLSRPMVDCEEYPCEVWFEVEPGADGRRDSSALNDCEAWVSRMGQTSSSVANGSLMRDGETVRYLGLTPRPPSHPWVSDPERSKRWTYRIDLNRERFADHVGATEATPVATAAASVRMLEELLEEAETPSDRAMWTQSLETARSRLEKLRSQQD